MDMDFRESDRVQPERSQSHAPHAASNNGSGTGKRLLLWLLALLLIGSAAAGGWYYRDTQAKDDDKVRQAEINSLKAENAKLKDNLTEAQSSATTATKPSQADLDNIEAAVKSGNYAALEQLMEDKVSVILAASEGLGDRTPTQAVTDLKYLDSGTDPWDFDLPAATIDGYQTGDYKQYFPDGALIGKSANDYVVSFSFGDKGKIKTIFMAANADTL